MVNKMINKFYFEIRIKAFKANLTELGLKIQSTLATPVKILLRMQEN